MVFLKCFGIFATKSLSIQKTLSFEFFFLVAAYGNSFADLEFTEGKRIFVARIQLLSNEHKWMTGLVLDLASWLLGSLASLDACNMMAHAVAGSSIPNCLMHWHVQLKRRLLQNVCHLRTSEMMRNDSAVKSSKLVAPSSNTMESRKPGNCRGSLRV